MSRPKRRASAVDRTAVANFVASLDRGMSYQDARGNLELDARIYAWSRETQAAIAIALCKFYFEQRGTP